MLEFQYIERGLLLAGIRPLSRSLLANAAPRQATFLCTQILRSLATGRIFDRSKIRTVRYFVHKEPR